MQRTQIVCAVRKAKERGVSVIRAVEALGVSRACYYRYAKAPELRKRRRLRDKYPLTPSERKAVLDMALAHPQTGYKRLCYLLQNEEIAGVRAHHVYSLLGKSGLLGSRAPVSQFALRRPQAPTAPDQVWHIDIMYVRVSWKWFYLVDILDAYSRYLVHWTLNPTMHTYAVTLSVQEALEKWEPTTMPSMVHDNGCQFLSKEWREFASHLGMPSIRTRVAHPESNGILERVHRTHRAEALQDTEDWPLERAKCEMTRWADVYNRLRPNLALHGLPPVVYYLGDPEAAIGQRDHFVLTAAEARRNYWQQQPQVVSQ